MHVSYMGPCMGWFKHMAWEANAVCHISGCLGTHQHLSSLVQE